MISMVAGQTCGAGEIHEDEATEHEMIIESVSYMHISVSAPDRRAIGSRIG